MLIQSTNSEKSVNVPTLRSARFYPSALINKFTAWFTQNSNQFATPIKIVKATNDFVEFEFSNYPKFLRGRLHIRDLLAGPEIGVYVNNPNRRAWQGRQALFIGWLLLLDAPAIRINKKFHCGHCEVSSLNAFETLEAFWEDHLFNELLAWVNEHLVSSLAIKMHIDPSYSLALMIHELPKSAAKLKLLKDEVFEIWEWEQGKFL